MFVSYLVTLLSVLGSSWAYTPSGPQIQLQAVLGTGGVVYVQNTGTGYTYTTSTAAATVFTLDTATGFLFQTSSDTANFPSGYSVPAVRNLGLLGTPVVTAYDGNTVTSATGYYPLSCSHTLALGPLQLSVPLVCLTNGLTNIYTGFGFCANAGNVLEAFGLIGNVQFLLGCGTGSSLVVNFNAILVSLPSTTPTLPAPTTSPNPVSSILGPTGTGSCSVTVILTVTRTTQYVGAGYTGPSVIGSGGSTTGPNPYGCEPITTTYFQ